MLTAKITSDHLTRKAIVYVRQSTAAQVRENLESQRRQYGSSTTPGRWGSATWS